MCVCARLRAVSRVLLACQGKQHQWVPEFFHGVRQPERDFDHSLQYSAEVKNEWSYTSVNPVGFLDVDRVAFTSAHFSG